MKFFFSNLLKRVFLYSLQSNIMTIIPLCFCFQEKYESENVILILLRITIKCFYLFTGSICCINHALSDRIVYFRC